MADFGSIIEKHNQHMAKRREATEQAQLAFGTSLENLTSSVLVDVSTISKQVYTTQKQIEQDTAQLEQQTIKILNESKDWNNNLRQFNNNLKQLGDIVNWSQVIEADMRFIAKGLDTVVIASQQQNNDESQTK